MLYLLTCPFRLYMCINMGDIDYQKCLFCLKIKYNDELNKVGIGTRQKLDALHLKLNLELSKTLICSECVTKLQTATDFKSACLDAQPKFLPFNTHEENVKEDILNENTSEEFVENQKLCRFCMKMVKIGCYTYLQEQKENVFLLDLVQKHIPELSLNTTDEIITCQSCLTSLHGLLGFITICWEAERQIDEKTFGSLSNSNESKDFILKKESCDDVTPSVVEKIKEEQDQSTTIKVEIIDEELREIQYPELNIKDEIESFHVPTVSKKEYKRDQSKQKYIYYKCQHCPYKTKIERLLKKHAMIHQDLSQVTAYKCEKCMYVTNRKYYLKRHILTHRTDSEITIYECKLCSYHTKHESSLNYHMKTHQRPPETKMYYCHNCSFQSKYKRNVRTHVLTHIDISAMQTYKCQRCLYGSNRKSQLKRHMLIHQDISEVKTYKCEFEGCNYVTKRKDCVKGHMVIHKKTSETYNCKLCDYKGKRKNSLYIHTMFHHSSSDSQVYKCGLCLYETTRKGSLKHHVLIHQKHVPSIYKCVKCPYKSKSKVNFNQHKLEHQRLSEQAAYKCERCTYETNHEDDLTQHMLTHTELVVIKNEIFP